MLKNYSKKGLLLILLFILVLISTFIYFNYYSSIQSNTVKTIQVGYNDQFPNLEYYQAGSVKQSSVAFNNNYNIVLYLSQSCSVCMDMLPEYRKIIDAHEDKAQYTMIWEGDIPSDKVIEFKLPININYSLKNKTSLSDTYPYYYITDNTSKVIFTTQDFQALKNKLSKL